MGKAMDTMFGQNALAHLAEKFRNDESGATAIEYGLILALIFLAIIGAVKGFTSSTNNMYNEIDTTIQDSVN